MANNIYRSAMGQTIDMDKLRMMNEKQPAVGNMNVNARGDDIAPDGSIVKSRNQKMREHYTEPLVKYNPGKRKQQAENRRAEQRARELAESQESIEDSIVDEPLVEEEPIKFEDLVKKPVVAPVQQSSKNKEK